MAIILNGNIVSKEINKKTIHEIQLIKKKYNLKPTIITINIENNIAASIYTKTQENKFSQIGFNFIKKYFDKNITTEKLLIAIKKFNNDKNIDGIFLQMPFPFHINTEKIINNINPIKDIDCSHPFNIGKLIINKNSIFKPCTPYGIIKLLEFYNINLSKKHAVIINRSNIIGKPMLSLLLQNKKNACSSVTMCHSQTNNLNKITMKADILIVAIGKANFIKSNMIKDNVIIIDIGINRIKSIESNKYILVGDVDYNDVINKVSFITPVPGGVGPITMSILLNNALQAYKLNNHII